MRKVNGHCWYLNFFWLSKHSQNFEVTESIKKLLKRLLFGRLLGSIDHSQIFKVRLKCSNSQL